jgi:hypothetical protein
MALTYRHSCYWGNPYTSPPNDLPRVLVVEESPCHRPSEKFSRKVRKIISVFQKKGVYGFNFGFSWDDDRPKRKWSQEAIFRNRRKRLLGRLEKKYSIPQLLDSAYKSEIEKRSEYFGT